MQESRSRSGVSPKGMTLAEVLVAIGIIGLLLALLLPAVQSSREQARVISCRNNLRQMVLAAHSYESTHRAFPYNSTRWTDSTATPAISYFPISPHRGLMSAIDPVIAKQIVYNDPTDPGWLTTPPTYFISTELQHIQALRVPFLCCPSDNSFPGSTSYRANLGISIQVLPPSQTIESISQKGAFVNGRAVPASEFRDGLSNTAFFSERVLGDSEPSRYDPFQDLFADGQVFSETSSFILHCQNDATTSPQYEYSFAGRSWLLGGNLNTWYSHVLPPNSLIPDCSLGPASVDGGQGIITARSFHRRGVNVSMADASLRFVSNSISAKTWRALGTRCGGEPNLID